MSRPHCGYFRPTFEPLETRCVPAASLAGSKLNIVGTEFNDTAIVSTYRAGDGRDMVRVVESATNSLNQSIPSLTRTTDFLASRVRQIIFTGGTGTDWFQNNTNLRSTAYGGAGNDTLWNNGAGASALFGEAGFDGLYGGSNADVIDGGSENDTIYGNGGNDKMFGGLGDDVLYGGDGIDFLSGGLGSDTLNDSRRYIGRNNRGVDVYEINTYKDDFNLAAPFFNGQQLSDIIQGGIGSCQALAAIGSALNIGIDFSRQIAYQGNGKYDVTLYKNGRAYQKSVKFDGSWTDNDARVRVQGVDGAGLALGDFWVTIVQRARLAEFNIKMDKSYSDAEWQALNVAKRNRLCDPVESVFRITGWVATLYNTNTQVTTTGLRNVLAAGEQVIASTRFQNEINASTGIVGNHAYVVLGINGDNSVRLYNPWNLDGLSSPDGTNDGFVTFSWTVFQAYFIYLWST